jgi:hypothetical protein
MGKVNIGVAIVLSGYIELVLSVGVVSTLGQPYFNDVKIVKGKTEGDISVLPAKYRNLDQTLAGDASKYKSDGVVMDFTILAGCNFRVF